MKVERHPRMVLTPPDGHPLCNGGDDAALDQRVAALLVDNALIGWADTPPTRSHQEQADDEANSSGDHENDSHGLDLDTGHSGCHGVLEDRAERDQE